MSFSKMFSGAALTLSSLASMASAHSWVHCTDYRGNININKDYTDAQCKGFPRDADRFLPGVFGQDTGFNYQPKNSSAMCVTGASPASYSNAHPMAVYQPGQKVRVVWPAKNHQAASCTNQFIPDTTMQLYMNCGLSADRNPTTGEFLSKSQLVIDWKANGGKGFQNCPDFCSNPDKAVCFEDFQVPTGLKTGQTCTFLWYWVFNNGDTPYTTCFEAEIGNGQAPQFPPAAAPTATAKPPQAPAPTAGGSSGSPSTGGGAKSDKWQQCGGKNWSGPTACVSGTNCRKQDDWYSQCVPSN